MTFLHDVVLDEEDICNLTREKKLILHGIENGQKMVIYGRRNSGKTSLLKNVIIPAFQKKHRNSFVMFCDLMEVKDMVSIASRLKVSFEKAFMQSFPKENLIHQIKNFFVGLRPQLTMDPLTGEPALSLASLNENRQITIEEIFEIIEKKISKKMDVLIVIDEFQDVSFVKEAQGLIRNAFQKMGKVPIVVMGSKKHMLSKMFAVPEAPFADFGVDIEFKDIPYEEYHVYSQKRLSRSGLKISFENSLIWQNLMFRNPEAMNILGFTLCNSFKNKNLSESDIRNSIDQILSSRSSRFEEYIGQLKTSDQEVLTALSKFGPVMEPSGKVFLKNTKLTHATVMKSIRFLENHSFIEKTVEGYQLVNPLLKYYLLKYR